MGTTLKAVVLTLFVCGVLSLGLTWQTAQADPWIGVQPLNAAVRCPLDIAWNPDAGPSTGVIAPHAGWGSFNMESESTTPVWICWASGTTRANYQTVCRKRCVGCNNGASYQADLLSVKGTAFCLASAGTDAGVVVSVEYGK